MIQRAGFFHFAEAHDDPIAALKAQINVTDVTKSLIVLPEAFNLGRQYREAAPCRFDYRAMISRLQELAAKSDVTFVAGLLETPRPADCLPFSAAYAIDANDSRLLCRKQQDDGWAGTRYAQCANNPDIENPAHFKDACLMAVICNDIEDGRRCAGLTRETERGKESVRIICICASMSGIFWFPNARCGEYIDMTPPPHSHNTRVVLANADANGPCSFITDTDWKVIHAVALDQRHVNRIVLSEI